MVKFWCKKHLNLVNIREALTILALLVGAAWAGFTFFATGQIDKAALEVKRLSQLVVPVINVQVQANQWRTDQVGDTILLEVTLTNQGQFKETLDMSQALFRVYPVQFALAAKNKPGQHGQLPIPNAAPWHSGAPVFPQKITQLELKPGEQERLTWLYRPPGLSIYYVEFEVPLSETSRQSWLDAGFKLDALEWADGVFLEVKKSMDGPIGATNNEKLPKQS